MSRTICNSSVFNPISNESALVSVEQIANICEATRVPGYNPRNLSACTFNRTDYLCKTSVDLPSLVTFTSLLIAFLTLRGTVEVAKLICVCLYLRAPRPPKSPDTPDKPPPALQRVCAKSIFSPVLVPRLGLRAFRDEIVLHEVTRGEAVAEFVYDGLCKSIPQLVIVLSFFQITSQRGLTNAHYVSRVLTTLNVGVVLYKAVQATGTTVRNVLVRQNAFRIMP